MRRGRILIALVIAVISIISYYSVKQENPITGQTQHIAMDVDQEVALGLEAAPQMAQEAGGLDPDPDVQRLVSQVGEHVVSSSDAHDTPYQFHFYALADEQTVNAFALPGGPVFITRGLLSKLSTEAELAGVLGHEVGHVVGRHTAAQIAKSRLAQGLIGAAGVAGSDEYGHGQQTAQLAALAAQMLQLKYGRGDEIQADTLGVRFMAEAGYDPRALIQVMRVLSETSGPSRGPEFLSTHPDPGNRSQVITAAIERRFPNGIPGNLTMGARLASASASRDRVITGEFAER
ncbi:MAG TPA: M48 family metalloprotease [Candidatus Eisenbacteria bacterium]|jgi:predicted Zn-dependent protease|nr:M48 family metalloprotease [Candidatus Eisenbacteria bacterium]